MNTKDLFGKALYDYWFDNAPEDMLTWTHLTESEVLPIEYLFRSFDEMPEAEQKALSLASGKILDVGAGSGIHSVWLQEKGKDVTALDFSEYGHKVLKDRKIQKVVKGDFFQHQGQYDTILLLMNGIGIVQKAQNLDSLFQHLNNLLTPNGQALIHSSDLKYLYEDNGNYILPKNEYYGDVQFFVSYKNEVESFDWTYIDEETLQQVALQNGFTVHKIVESEYGDFLMRFTRE